jgi:hemerythrin
MARTKGAKNKKPAKSVTKKRDFALVHPKNAPGSGLPSNYLYGKSSSGSNKAAAPRRKFKPVRKNGPPPPSKSFSVKVKLHDKQHGMIVPWRRNVAKSQKPHTKSSKVQQLNGFLVKESSLHHLNQELIQFADYVKLTAAEREARERIIQNIKSVCRQLFGIDDKDCQTFGSFAVPGVCTFSSDVDMAIWGAVAKDEDDALEDRNEATVTTQDPNRKRIVSLAEAEGFHSEDDQKMCSISNSLQDHPNRKKQERLLRWKKALDQTWMATPSANKQPALESQQTGDEVQIDPSQITKSEEGNGLFVLDRMGVEECGDGQKSKAEESSEHGESDSRKQDESDKDKESCNGNDSDDDDSDDADKLEALWLRAGQDEAGFVNRSESVAGLQFAEENDDGEEEEEEEEEGMVIKSNRPRGQSMVSLSSATTCSEDERFDDSALEVSYTVDRTGGKQTLGPTGRDRTAVVNALYKIARRMRPHAATLHVRKKASKSKCCYS